MNDELQARYEPVRLREQAVLGRLLELLQRIDHAPPATVEQVRDALFHADNPFLIVLVGPFSAGKSAIINALIGEPVLEVGPTPTTNRITILRYGESQHEVRDDASVYTRFHPAPILERVSFVDTPGLESVFTAHDAITRRFLHRADVVFLVMLATQALPKGSLADLRELLDYGKPVILLANQADLLEAGQRDEVRTFIAKEVKQHLGVTLEVWLVSAKTARSAPWPPQADDPTWRESGMDAVMAYITERLNDEERLRRKLQTPIDIGQHATRETRALVEADLERLGEHRRAVENLRAQIDKGVEEQRRIADALAAMVDPAFDLAAERGAQAIGHMFRFGAAFGMLRRGLAELIGLSRFTPRLTAGRYAEQAFELYHVCRPLEDLDAEAARLAPRLEGADLQDLDRLVEYGRAQVERLPPTLRDKVVGQVAAPAAYRRDALERTGHALRNFVKEATVIDGSELELAVRNALLSLAAWELVIIAVVVVFRALGLIRPEDGPAALALVAVLALLGFMWMPFQAIRVSRRYTGRLDRLREQFKEALEAGVRQHMAYARELRERAVQPYTRLIETQAGQIEAIRGELAEVQRELAGVEGMLKSLR